MNADWVEKTEPWLLRLLALLGVVFIGSYACVASQTVAYPYFLDWTDGGMAEEVVRIQGGYFPYARPTATYVANLYTPLYFYVSAFVSLCTGNVMLAMRLVSLLATTGIGILLYRWVRREGGTQALALVAAGLFFATFPIGGWWFNVSRPDMLFIYCLLGGCYVARTIRERGGAPLAGLLLAIAFLTKQSAMLAILPVLAAGMLAEFSRWRVISLWCLLPTALMVLCFHLLSGPWFTYFVFVMPAKHPLLAEEWLGFWTNDLWHPMWPCCLLTAVALVLLFRRDRKSGLFFIAMGAGCFAVSYASRLHDGGYFNVLIPAYIMLAFLSMLAVVQLRQRLSVPGRICYALSLALVFMQFAMLWYDPSAVVPKDSDYKAGAQFVDYMRQSPGEVLIPRYPFLPQYAGKASYGWGSAGWDILRSDAHRVHRDFVDDVNHSLAAGAYSTLFLSDGDEDYLQLKPLYCYKETMSTGMWGNTLARMSMPVRVYVKCR